LVFKKGLEKPIIIETENHELPTLHASGVFAFAVSENSSDSISETKQQAKPCNNLNAFDIISFSSGFDLSGLFEDTIIEKETRFLSNKPATIIISKLEEICKCLCLKVKKKDGGLLKLESRKGTLNIDVEIFEISPHFHLVELKKSDGDTSEYQRLMQQEIRPALKDIVWDWQGELPQHLQHEVVLEEQQPSLAAQV